MAKKQNLTNTALLILAILFVQVSLAAKSPSDLSKNNIIPKPVSVSATGGYFVLKSHSAIYLMGESPELKQIGLMLAEKLKLSTGYGIEVKAHL
jgi:hexosaminidase